MTLASLDYAAPPPWKDDAFDDDLEFEDGIVEIDHNYFFNVIASLLLGRKGGRGDPRGLSHHTSMLSGWGWTIFSDCYFDNDPQSIVPWRIWIQRGIPYNNGRTAHRIVDGTDTTGMYLPGAEKVDGATAIVHPQCAIEVEDARFLIAHRGDAFVVSRRYALRQAHQFLSVGYNALSRSRWNVPVIEKCTAHCQTPGSEQSPAKLDLGVATVRGFIFEEQGIMRPASEQSVMGKTIDERIAVALTAGNRHAQWMALISASTRLPILRRRNVCMNCFILEASEWTGELLLIL